MGKKLLFLQVTYGNGINLLSSLVAKKMVLNVRAVYLWVRNSEEIFFL